MSPLPSFTFLAFSAGLFAAAALLAVGRRVHASVIRRTARRGGRRSFVRATSQPRVRRNVIRSR